MCLSFPARCATVTDLIFYVDNFVIYKHLQRIDRGFIPKLFLCSKFIALLIAQIGIQTPQLAAVILSQFEA